MQKQAQANDNPVKGFLALLSFLTIIPSGVYDLVLAAKYFYLVPLVGLLEGAIVVAPLYTSLPVELKTVLALSLSYLVTGFNHLDGFADFADAIASRRRGKEALRIIKEPWKGPMAIASTILIVLITYSSLRVLVDEYYVVIAAHVLAGESMYLLALFSKQPDYEGLGKLFIMESKHTIRTIFNITLLVVVLVTPLWAYGYNAFTMITVLLMTLSMMVAVLYTYVKAHSILGYSNGDVLGFCYELAKTVLLLTAAIPLSVLP